MRVRYVDRLDSLKLRRRAVYEPAETQRVSGALKPGMTFVDVGAHIGYYTLLASAQVGATGMVFAFEPSPENMAVLNLNVIASGATNVVMSSKAVGETVGPADLYLNPQNTGDNRVPWPGVPTWRRVLVEMTTLDAFLADWTRGVDFLKVDTQGYELAVLRGAGRVLAPGRPMAALVEYWPHGIVRSGDDPGALLAELGRLGFNVAWPAPEVLARCTPENGKHCNLFAVR